MTYEFDNQCIYYVRPHSLLYSALGYTTQTTPVQAILPSFQIIPIKIPAVAIKTRETVATTHNILFLFVLRTSFSLNSACSTPVSTAASPPWPAALTFGTRGVITNSLGSASSGLDRVAEAVCPLPCLWYSVAVLGTGPAMQRVCAYGRAKKGSSFVCADSSWSWRRWSVSGRQRFSKFGRIAGGSMGGASGDSAGRGVRLSSGWNIA